jgi:hypothetical protein
MKIKIKTKENKSKKYYNGSKWQSKEYGYFIITGRVKEITDHPRYIYM